MSATSAIMTTYWAGYRKPTENGEQVITHLNHVYKRFDRTSLASCGPEMKKGVLKLGHSFLSDQFSMAKIQKWSEKLHEKGPDIFVSALGNPDLPWSEVTSSAEQFSDWLAKDLRKRKWQGVSFDAEGAQNNVLALKPFILAAKKALDPGMKIDVCITTNSGEQTNQDLLTTVASSIDTVTTMDYNMTLEEKKTFVEWCGGLDGLTPQQIIVGTKCGNTGTPLEETKKLADYARDHLGGVMLWSADMDNKTFPGVTKNWEWSKEIWRHLHKKKATIWDPASLICQRYDRSEPNWTRF